MKKVIFNQDPNTINIVNCTEEKFYLVESTSNMHWLIIKDLNNFKWINMKTARSGLIDGNPTTITKVLENYSSFHDIYQFNTMQELLEYYLEQIKSKK